MKGSIALIHNQKYKCIEGQKAKASWFYIFLSSLMISLGLLSQAVYAGYYIPADSMHYSNQSQPEITIIFAEPVNIKDVNFTAEDGAQYPVSQHPADATNITWIFKPINNLENEIKHTLVVIAKDNAQNEMRHIIVIKIDRSLPIRQTYTPNSTITTDSPLIAFNFTESVVPIILVKDVLSGEIVNITSLLFSSNKNRTFSYRFTSPLDDGQKEVVMGGTDYAFNPISSQYSYFFIINSNPLGIQLRFPRFGYARSQTGNLTITTSLDATCKWSLIEEPYDSMAPMIRVTPLIHMLNPFDMSQKTVYIKCRDPYGLIVSKSFDISYLTSPSQFNVEATPNPVIEPSQMTQLKVISSDRLLCKYSNTTTDFAQMIPFPGYDEESSDAYNAENTVQLSYSVDDLAAYFFSYNITCINMAGFVSSPKEYRITVDLRVPLSIEVISPPGYSNGNSVNLIVRTNKNCICWYDDEDVSVASPQLGMPNSVVHQVNLGNLLAGQYSYEILCRKTEDARITASFVVDKTNPSITNITVQNITCEKKLKADFYAFDGESGIDYYSYQLKDSSARIISDWSNSTKDEASIIVASIDPSKSYIFYAKAINKVGLIGEVGYSHGIRYDPNNTQCREKIPPNVNLILTKLYHSVNVTLNCFDEQRGSGCDYNSIYYGTSAENGNCSATSLYYYPVTLFSSKKMCWKVKDLAGNERTGAQNISIEEEPAINPCSNSILDGTESSADCGGLCLSKCQNGLHCNSSLDCISQYCDDFTKKCASISCNDSIMNGGEVGIDCGAVCEQKCQTGTSCEENDDCATGICADSFCTEPSCSDSLVNGNETDTDCGGTSCPLKCAIGKSCRDDIDCQDNYCDDFQKCEEYNKKDTDSDQIPDYWEDLYGLDKKDPSDALLDPDEDLLANTQEFVYNTDPQNPDTDDDSCSDGKEVEQGVDPVDPESKCSSEGLPLWAMILIGIGILVGIGAGVYYYKSINREKFISQQMPSQIMFRPAVQREHSEEEKKRRQEMDDKYKKRIEEKANKRKDFLGVFGEPSQDEVKQGEEKKGAEQSGEAMKDAADKKVKEPEDEWVDLTKDKKLAKKRDVFDELDEFAAKKGDKKQKGAKKHEKDVFDELDEITGNKAKKEEADKSAEEKPKEEQLKEEKPKEGLLKDDKSSELTTPKAEEKTDNEKKEDVFESLEKISNKKKNKSTSEESDEILDEDKEKSESNEKKPE